MILPFHLKKQGFAAARSSLLFQGSEWRNNRAYSLTIQYMNQAKFLSTLASLMKGYPGRSQEHIDDPILAAKIFDMSWSGTWYLSEYDPKQRVAFGYVTGLAFDEWGYVSIDELIALRWHGVVRIEIDLFFTLCRASEIIGK